MPAPESPPSAVPISERQLEEGIIYFVLPDQFENGDPRCDRGGINGLAQRLDYSQGMGVTAIWFAPVFKSKPVQGKPGEESASYHGYWVTDFTQIDQHFGTNAEFKAFVDAAHARGMKVYMDIITNHTADVIDYAEGEANGHRYHYSSKGEYPFSRRGGPEGGPINSGFAGDDNSDPANRARLTDPTFAYTPVVRAAARNVKVPARLNDVTLYHNRGNSHWAGEISVYGDFSGLDDLATEHPRVVQRMIDIFAGWSDDYSIDGFCIDTAKHVNPQFWQAFVPATLARASDGRNQAALCARHGLCQGGADGRQRQEPAPPDGRIPAAGRDLSRRSHNRARPADLPRQPRFRAFRDVCAPDERVGVAGHPARPRQARPCDDFPAAWHADCLLRRRARLHL